MSLDPDPLYPDFRDYLRANMFDGDEGGTVTMPIRRLLDEVTELAADYAMPTWKVVALGVAALLFAGLLGAVAGWWRGRL